MNFLAFFEGGQFVPDADLAAPVDVDTPEAAATALILREGVSTDKDVIVLPGEAAVYARFAWGTDAAQPTFAQSCIRYTVTPDGIPTQTFPAP